MAKLINGNGNPAIYAAEDADLIASLAGNVTCIANVGNKYAATEEDATTIRLDDGVIITKEGRRIQLEAGESDTFYIPTGTSGQTNYYIIGYKLVQNADSTQVAEQFVQKMNSSSETITEDTFRSGATEVYVSVYRVTQVGFTIDSVDRLLPELLDSASIKEDIEQINSDLFNKVANSARVSNSILDINGSDFSLQGKVKNSQRELFALVAYDTDSFKYLHTTDGGTTWTTIWEISPTALATQVGNINTALDNLATQVGTNTTNINTVANIGVTSVDTSKFIDQGYSYAKALNNGHLVNVSLIYRITSSSSNDITIARLGGNYPTSAVFGTCYISDSNNAYPVYIDTSGYIHIQLNALKTFSNSLLALNMTYLR